MPVDAPTPRPDGSQPKPASATPKAPDVMTELICERCGNANLIRVKGCWYCERCHHKFDCYGW